ncbi:MAG: hypothetical protein JXA99_03915 [Candidatus Lokiarchaeota archaeon]|nr:hypothetical protein [Candidatus Lokiarchaeota archaeon]
MKKLNFNFMFFVLFFILIISCGKKEHIDLLVNYKKPKIEIAGSINNSTSSELYRNNLINLKNNYPFYIIRLKAPLYLKKPGSYINIPSKYILLKFGDVLFPVKERNPVKNFYYVKTIDNKYGWISNNCGISVNYDVDTNLQFFGGKFYLKSYIESNGQIDNSNKLVLIKNIVPLLLENYFTDGWFYPNDYQLALDLSLLSVDIAQDTRTLFFASSVITFRKFNEILISLNLLADCYQKLKFYDKAEEIHKEIIRRHMWKESYNSEIGGLTSVIKLEQIYLDLIKDEKIDSSKYKELKQKIIENILIVANEQRYYIWSAKDKRWKGLSFSEWLLDILRKSISREEFYAFCKQLSDNTTSDGFKDMIDFYVAIEMYKEGKKEEALYIINNYKPKNDYKVHLRMNDWLSSNKIIPDSIIYQYIF